MDHYAVLALLLAALALPVVAFWLLRSRTRLHGLVAAGIAVALGWALNLAYAFAAQDPAPAADDNVAIAAAFGWACPAVLVLLTWLARRFVVRRARADKPQVS
ncbi:MULTISPECIES: hypothetical protein [unclassified Lysobacter]|uniref:hypothetical protein n=1 Tax=unclassified Lysobacter TaxID=2635362 RepID=UPI0007014A9D|nr:MULTISPECIES: hypothetical protein [unclassified Lysobacter]KRA20302.1 hypothetical protein ASD69_02850 [Lysobacter sp. Root604]KRD39313.1 hypothetical protein ASE35_02825 [Lysobacter sp. Root916]KRD74543.1 hypothetical protein ASE43_15000 [Lysobacter sp. Root983]